MNWILTLHESYDYDIAHWCNYCFCVSLLFLLHWNSNRYIPTASCMRTLQLCQLFQKSTCYFLQIVLKHVLSVKKACSQHIPTLPLVPTLFLFPQYLKLTRVILLYDSFISSLKPIGNYLNFRLFSLLTTLLTMTMTVH